MSTEPLVFGDGFGSHVIWQPFLGSKYDALTFDTSEHIEGTTSLKVTIPAAGPYAGGAFTTNRLRNLSSYNALSFWVMASRPVTLETAGLGNDNTGKSKFDAKRTAIAIPGTKTWMQVLIPIPNPAKLTAEGGMFYFAQGPVGGADLTLWFDDMRFVNTTLITNPRPILGSRTLNTVAGLSVNMSATTNTVFSIRDTNRTVNHMLGYLDFLSSNPAIAAVSSGSIRILSEGTTTISAQLGTPLGPVNAAGAITVNATAPPTTAAPTPTLAASDVISLYSDAYPSRAVDTWSANWNQPVPVEVVDFPIAGNPTKLYMNLSYAGVEFKSPPVDASAMTTFHMDVWAPSGTTFKVKLVDFGADGVFGGNNDTESELTFNASSPITFVPGTWNSLEIPLANFATMTSRAHVAQLVPSSPDAKTVYVDNVYFHK